MSRFTMPRRIGHALAVATLLTPAAACGSPSAPPIEVQVTATEFAFEASQMAFEVGKRYRFVVTNRGQVPHEFTIIPPGEAHSTSGHANALTTIAERDLPPGATKSVEVTFKKPAPEGTLEIACHVPGHYEAGMALAIRA